MNIKVHRLIQKKKQAELAEHLGITTVTLGRYENDIGRMPTRLLVKTAAYLKTTPNDLLEEYMENKEEQ